MAAPPDLPCYNCRLEPSNQFEPVEGQWEELIRHSEQFAGRRVRVTVLADKRSDTSTTQDEIRRWLAEGNAMEFAPPSPIAKPGDFGTAVAEKFRKQGLEV